jgi:hypothetical protein
VKGGPRSIGGAIGRLTRPSLRARGFGAAELLMRWRTVVGDTLADNTAPERLVWPAGRSEHAVLKLRVAPGFATDVQHLSPLIIERINGFFGYQAVARLSLTQGPLPAPPPGAVPPRPLTDAERERLETLLAGVTDPNLRESLARLGSALLAAS